MSYISDMIAELRLEAHAYGVQYGVPGSGDNDPLDAFRHAYSSALMAFWYGPNIAQLGGDYREWDTPNPREVYNMDQYNNAVGRDIAGQLRDYWEGQPWLTTEEIKNEAARLVNEAYLRGDLIVDPFTDTRKFNGFDFFRLKIEDAVDSFWGMAQRIVLLLDPLTFDLDGDGLETVSAAQSGVLFDHDGDGIHGRTGSGLYNCIKMFSQSFGDCDGTARSLLKPGHQVAYG